MNQRELILAAQAGDARAADALIRAHTGLVYHIARLYFITGADRDDVIQEGFIALHEAVMRFDFGGEFGMFAGMVIKRRLIDAMKEANRLKHLPLSSAVRSVVMEDGERCAAVDLIESIHAIDPHRFSVVRETMRALIEASKALSPLERRAVMAVAAGVPYEHLGDPKQIDNAVQRARRKLAA